jgi:hypothetical protein
MTTLAGGHGLSLESDQNPYVSSDSYGKNVIQEALVITGYDENNNPIYSTLKTTKNVNFS